MRQSLPRATESTRRSTVSVLPDPVAPTTSRWLPEAAEWQVDASAPFGQERVAAEPVAEERAAGRGRLPGSQPRPACRRAARLARSPHGPPCRGARASRRGCGRRRSESARLASGVSGTRLGPEERELRPGRGEQRPPGPEAAWLWSAGGEHASSCPRSPGQRSRPRVRRAGSELKSERLRRPRAAAAAARASRSVSGPSRAQAPRGRRRARGPRRGRSRETRPVLPGTVGAAAAGRGGRGCCARASRPRAARPSGRLERGRREVPDLAGSAVRARLERSRPGARGS